MRSRDTSDKAAAIAAAVNRSLTPEQRFAQALELSDVLHDLAKAGMRQRHPEYSDEELVRNLTIALHGVSPRK